MYWSIYTMIMTVKRVVSVISNLKKACELQEKGLYLYPLATGTKVPLKGSSGSNDATNNYNQIHECWSKEPSLNIGLNLSPHRWVVIDIDVNHDNGANGWENFKKLKRPLAPTYTEKTPNGGFHYFYKLPKDVEIQQQQNAFSDVLGIEKTGIDICIYGIPIAPTATNEGQYEAMDGKTFNDITELPSWVAPLLKKKEPISFNGVPGIKHNSGDLLDQIVKGVGSGQRNTYIRVICDRMLGTGADLETIWELVEVANEHFLDEPLPMREVQATYKTRVRNHLMNLQRGA